jgi:hypothetical protein
VAGHHRIEEVQRELLVVGVAPARHTQPEHVVADLVLALARDLIGIRKGDVQGSRIVALTDARSADWLADIWITNPGYGDAVHYDELSEFFLAWYDKQLVTLPNTIGNCSLVLFQRGCFAGGRMAWDRRHPCRLTPGPAGSRQSQNAPAKLGL